jgi:hypothetical protein
MPPQFLVLEQPAHRQRAARIIRAGELLCVPFANSHVLAARSTVSNVRAANRRTGRPLEQNGSIVTSPEHLAGVFDWRRLPHGLGRAQVLDLMYDLLASGPFAFRGPAVADLPAHLTADELGVRTVQLVSPGFECPSNEVFSLATDRLGDERYLFATSIEAPLARAAGIACLRRTAPRAYPGHLPTSPSVLSIHNLAVGDGQPSLILERPGSLPLVAIRRAAARQGLGIVVPPADDGSITAVDPASTTLHLLRLRQIRAL